MATNTIPRALSERLLADDGKDTVTALNRELIPLLRDIRTVLNNGSAITEYVGSGGSTTIPSASGVGSGLVTRVLVYVNNGTGALTLTASAGETINGAASMLLLPGGMVLLVADSDTWSATGVQFTAQFDPALGGAAGTLTPEDSARPMVIAERDSVKFRASGVTSNSYAVRQIAYEIDHAGHSLPVAAFGLRVLATETDRTGLGGNHVLIEARVNGTRHFSVVAPNGATPSITNVNRFVASDTVSIGGTSITCTNVNPVTIGAAKLVLGDTGQEWAYAGGTPSARGAAIADATDLASAIARLNELLAFHRTKNEIAT